MAVKIQMLWGIHKWWALNEEEGQKKLYAD